MERAVTAVLVGVLGQPTARDDLRDPGLSGLAGEVKDRPSGFDRSPQQAEPWQPQAELTSNPKIGNKKVQNKKS